jgi:hypothetical protein
MRIDALGTTTVTGGFLAAQPSAGTAAFAAGDGAGVTNQGDSAVAVGRLAGNSSQGTSTVAIGNTAGQTSQGGNSIAVGKSAGESTQGGSCVAVGSNAGNSTQGANAVAVGNDAGKTTQGTNAVAVGTSAGKDAQSNYATAVGGGSGNANQGEYGVSVGYKAGNDSQGASSIAIGNRAGETNQGANGIIINSSGNAANAVSANHILLKSSATGYLYYNGSTSWTFEGGDVTVPNGGVVIGTSSAMTQGGGGPLSVYSAGGSQLILGKSTGAPSISFGSTLTQYGMMEGQSGGGFKWYTGNGSMVTRMTLDNSGNLTATGNVTAYSDERLKDNVETLDGSKVYDMRGVSFTKDGEAGSGVIAQELQMVAPELVHEGEEYLSVAYGNLVGYLIEAVKDLKAEVEELKRAK